MNLRALEVGRRGYQDTRRGPNSFFLNAANRSGKWAKSLAIRVSEIVIPYQRCTDFTGSVQAARGKSKFDSGIA